MVLNKVTAERVTLDDELLHRFERKKVFDEGCSINDVDMRGRCMLTTGGNDMIVVWDTYTGSRKTDIPSKKYGCGLVRCVPSTSAVDKAVHTSNKHNDALRYLSLDKKTYISYFEGHEDTVTALEMAATGSMFMSGARDSTVSVWDMRSPHRQGVVHTTHGGRNDVFVTIDPVDARCFAVLQRGDPHIRVYDIRSFDKAPFLTIPTKRTDTCSQLQFSPTGAEFALTRAGGEVLVYDSFNGAHQQSIGVPAAVLATNERYAGFVASAAYSVDGHYILLSTAADGVIAHTAKEGRHVHTMAMAATPAHDCVTKVACSEQMALIVSTGNNVTFYATESVND